MQTSLRHDLLDGLLEIRQQVAPVLNADRNPHEAVADLRLFHFCRRKSGVGGGFRMARQALDAAERYGIARDLEIPQQRERGIAAAVEIDGENAARIITLGLADANLLVVFKQ